MFEFLTLRLRNFAFYSDLELDLSPIDTSEGSKDSVLIRGHNEHGKTTLFRGLLWTVFGKDGLEKAEHLPARDVLRLQGAKGHQEHLGQLVFRSESSTYRITRTGETGEASDRVNEQVRVHKFCPTDEDDPWKNEPAVERSLAELYFPPDLAPYLFLNADKVYSIVGEGSASGQIEEVTQAINDMLGITAVKKAAQRVKEQQSRIRKDLSQRIGADTEKEKLERTVVELEEQVEKEEKAALRAAETLEQLNAQLQARDAELKDLEEQDDGTAVYVRKHKTQQERDAAATAYRDAMKELREDFSARELFVPFFAAQACEVHKKLSQLHVEGIIPRAELPLLTKLLDPAINEEELCICGETHIGKGTDARARLQQLVDNSQAFEEGANRLDKIRSDLNELVKTHLSQQQEWVPRFAKHVQLVEETREALSEAQSRLHDAEREVHTYEETAVGDKKKLLRQELKDIRDQRNNHRASQSVARAKLDGGEDDLGRDHSPGLRTQLAGAQRKLSSYYDRVRDAQHLAQAEKAADKVREVLELTVRRIQEDQIVAVSNSMNTLFLNITNNGVEVATDELGHTSVTSGVGIRQVPARPGRFELFAETASGDSKPLHILNGASRQALTVSFLVALLQHSDAPIPIVADSLFHPLSGSVKFRLAKHLLATKVQKIVTLTHDDVQRPQMRNLLRQHAARTYTVTNLAKRQDLANSPAQLGSVVAVCTCGPDEYCDLCELAAVEGESPTQSLQENAQGRRVL